MAPTDPALDSVMAKILAASDLTAQKTLLNDLPEHVFTAKAFTSEDPLDAISPAENSLAYLYFLLYRCKASHGFHPALMEKLWAFVSTCDGAQIRLASDKAMSFAEALVKMASESQQPIIAIRPLATFIQRIQSNAGQLTMIHPLLAKTCLLAQSFKDIIPILDNDITDVDPSQTSIDYRDILLYNYYGGMIYAYLKRFERAIDFFQIDVTSAIQIEAHKKYVLTSLLHLGKVPPLPKYTAQLVLKALKMHSAAYIDFAGAYEKKSNGAIKSELEKIKPQLIRDKNFGLAKQCMEALHRRNIQDLTRTYLTLSIENIASAIGLGSDPAGQQYVEGIIVQMIESGDIFARISHEHAGGMVSFLDDPNQHNNTATMDTISAQIQSATEITAKLTAMDQKISTMPEFFSKGRHGPMPDFGGYPMDESDYGMQMGYENYVDEASSSTTKRQRRKGPRARSDRSRPEEYVVQELGSEREGQEDEGDEDNEVVAAD